MLRLWVVGAAVWMALVLVMTVVRSASSRSGRNWLVAGAGAAALALVLVADVAGAEAFVARHNIERARHGADLDTGYLAHLSDDAVPAIASAVESSDDPQVRSHLVAALLCHDDREGAAALNLAAARAADIRRDVLPALATGPLDIRVCRSRL
jgi:D-arabinose 1-dehydrogenase-like Zn-dependent alcohol dehydrogenase